MTEEKWEDEPEKFGNRAMWMLLNRNVVDGVRMSVRVMPVTGRGVLFQTTREKPARGGVFSGSKDDQAWEVESIDQAVLVDDVAIMEFMEQKESVLKDENDKPLTITNRITGREIVSVSKARERLQPGKKGRDARREKLQSQIKRDPDDAQRKKIIDELRLLAAQGPHDGLMIIPGAVLTQVVPPAQDRANKES